MRIPKRSTFLLDHWRLLDVRIPKSTVCFASSDVNFRGGAVALYTGIEFVIRVLSMPTKYMLFSKC